MLPSVFGRIIRTGDEASVDFTTNDDDDEREEGKLFARYQLDDEDGTV